MKRFLMFALVALISVSVATGGAAEAAKKELVIGMPGDPTTFDPHIRLGLPMLQSWPLVFDNVLSRDSNGKIGPGLAESWKFLSPKVLELKIRKNAKFHNGEALDANAVKYSLDRIFDPKIKSRIKNFYRSLKKVEVVDSYTLRIHTKTPDRFLLSPLADFSAVVPPKYYGSKKLKYLARNPVGSGPYRLTKWRKGSEMVFEAAPGYWDPARQRVKKVVIKVIPESTTRVSALLADSVDMIKDIPPQMVPMAKSKSDVDVVAGPGPKACSIIMVLKEGSPWTDVRVRQAVNYGINKRSIVKNVLQGNATVALGTVVGPKSVGHNSAVGPYTYNPAKARKLLKEAGYEKGFTVPLMVPIGRYLKGVQGAEAIAGQLKKLNITVQVKPLEYGAWRRNSRSKWKKGYPAYWNYACRNDIALHAAWMYSGLLYSKSTHGGVRSEKLDKMIVGARAEADPAVQVKKYQDLGRYVKEQALLIFLYHLDEVAGKKKYVDWKRRADGLVIATDAGLK